MQRLMDKPARSDAMRAGLYGSKKHIKNDNWFQFGTLGRASFVSF